LFLSNDKAKLTVIDPEIEAVVELKDLPSSIRSFRKYAFSPEQLEIVGQAIIKKASDVTRH